MALDALKRMLPDLELQERNGTLDDKSRAILKHIRELVRGSKPLQPPDLRQRPERRPKLLH